MSDMEAKHIKLRFVGHYTDVIPHSEEISPEDAEEILHDHYPSYVMLNCTEVWEKVVFEKLDPYGFTKVLSSSDGEIELITLFYNGGGHWTEVVEDALNEQ